MSRTDSSRRRSRSPRGQAPSDDMFDRPIYASDLEGLRVVDLRSIVEDYNLPVAKSADKTRLVYAIADFMTNTGTHVYLNRDLIQASSPRNKNTQLNFDRDEFARFIMPMINSRSTNYDGYRNKWNYLVAQTTRWGREHGMVLSATDAAQMLDPYYKAQRERRADEPGTQSGSRRRRNSGNYNNSYITEADIRDFINSFNGSYNGSQNFRSSWQALISNAARRFNLDSSKASSMLDPYYESQRARYSF